MPESSILPGHAAICQRRRQYTAATGKTASIPAAQNQFLLPSAVIKDTISPTKHSAMPIEKTITKRPISQGEVRRSTVFPWVLIVCRVGAALDRLRGEGMSAWAS